VETPIVDVLGIGFGPSNLALAIAVAEHNETTNSAPVTARFLERKPALSWHPGMLIDGATMQVSFLKDMATLRNPRSRFGFLSYLQAKDRLIDFVNHKVLYPTRIEFHDYLSWCADQVGQFVEYGREVVSVRPLRTGDMVTHFEVISRETATGEPVVRWARNLAVAPGLHPRMPDGVSPSPRVWHSSTLLDSLATFEVPEPKRFVVLGAGQSAAEVTEYLHRTYPTAEVCTLFSRFGYSQADDSPYANRIFDPQAVDVFHTAPEEVKSRLLRYHANTNYAVVDVDLIEDLYRQAYLEKVRGTSRLRLLNVSELAGLRERADAVEIDVRYLPTGRVTTLDADVLVCASGYRPTDPRTLLGEAASLLRTDVADRLVVERNYRVATDPEVLAGVFLCGATEHSHGITSSLLSMAAVRAGEILRVVVGSPTGHATARYPGRSVARPESVPAGTPVHPAGSVTK